MERKLALGLSNGRALEGQIFETETLTSQPFAISDVVSEDQAEIFIYNSLGSLIEEEPSLLL